MENQRSLPYFKLTVLPESLVLFTTVLQSGIEIKSHTGISMGRFLDGLPGFTAEYVGDVVQTIFLNGTAIDDLTTPLTGNNPVLALSAAMPGLAGAIFRRNSFHSALRTDTKKTDALSRQHESSTVTLKLFNTIARDRGTELLRRGVCMKTAPLTALFTKSITILHQIKEIEIQGTKVDSNALLSFLLQSDKINIQIVKAHG